MDFPPGILTTSAAEKERINFLTSYSDGPIKNKLFKFDFIYKHVSNKSSTNNVRCKGTVPDRRSRILEVVIVRRLVTWVLGILRGEGLGKGLRKGRSVYKQPETRVDGSCHS